MAAVKPHTLEHWAPGTVEERIHHLRRIILVHSVLYYRFDTAVVSDHQFDSWGRELADTQRSDIDASERVLYHREAYRDFGGESGYFLPLYDRRATQRALWLARIREREVTDV